MICIEDIFSDIKAGLGRDAWVGLPSGVEHPSQPLLDRSALAIAPDRIYDVVTPIAPEDRSAKDNEKTVGSQAPHIPFDAAIYVRGYRLWILNFALMLSVFLVSHFRG
jgi:hypothetical protein